MKRNIDFLNDMTAKWGEGLAKRITPKVLSIFLTVMYAVSLLPLLWIGWYNYPSADDYSIGSNCHRVWVESGNVFAVLWAGVERAVEDWITWMGYFTSNFLMAVPPSTFGERCYVLTPWIILGILTLGTWYLLRTVFVKVFHADKYISNSVIMLTLFITVQCMQGRVEAFYWYSGAANYMFVHGMSLLFYGLVISLSISKDRMPAWKLILASCLGFLVGGGNQMSALNVAIVLLVAVGFGVYLKQWKKYKGVLVPIVSFYVGFVLNVAAPGNWVRAEGAVGMSPVKAILVSLYYTLDYCLNQWTGWPVVLLLIILVPLFWKMTEKTKFQFSYPLIAIAFGYGLVSAMLTPPLFAVGNIAAARLQALTFAMYILVLILCEGYVIGWFRKHVMAGNTQEKNGFEANQCWCILGCMAFFLAATALTIIPDSHYFTWSSAVTDLANGSAKAYGEALEERIELYQSGEQNIVVEPLKDEKPVLLYFSDIKPDAEDWENRGLCRYYGIESVRVGEQEK